MTFRRFHANYTDALRSFLKRGPLPGLEAQRRLAPASRFPSDYDPMPGNARRAAVLILICAASRVSPESRVSSAFQISPESNALPEPDALRIVFIERPHDGSTHSGEIAFPGGAHEGEERFPEETALREAWEETGVEADALSLCGTLTPLYIPVSNFSVVPVVATAEREPTLRAEPGEVAAIHTVPLSAFRGDPVVRDLPPNRRVSEAPGYELEDHFVWGATAMMLAELVEVDRRIRSARTH